MAERKGTLTGYKWRFWAEAVGPKGTYKADSESDYVPGWYESPHGDNKKTTGSLDALVGRLTAKGWEPTGRGDTWWDYRFRRPVKRA